MLDFRLAGSLSLRFFVGDVPKRGVCWSDGSNAGPAALMKYEKGWFGVLVGVLRLEKE